MLFFVTAARGTEGPLRREIAALRIAGARGDHGGVWFEGPLAMGMQVCLHARVAVRVLAQVAAFEAGDADSLYAGARAVDWKTWLTARSTLAVHATISHGDPERVPRPPRDGLRAAKPRYAHATITHGDPDRVPRPPRDGLPAARPRYAHAKGDAPALTHTGFAALKVKDAVVDALRDALGARPDVDPKDPDVAIVLHVAGRQAALFLDLAGQPLHRRGYRVAMTEAPLKETLAAAVLALGRVRADLPFVDPMAGSGTLAVEHALAARGIAPGLRRRFGFERWPAFDEALQATWRGLRAEAEAAAEAPRAPLPPIVCRDVSADAVGAARRNASAASVDDDITFEVGDVGTLDRRWPAGTVCTNPPYGERLAAADLGPLYRAIGRAFMRLGGWGVVVLSGNPLFSRALPLKPVVSHRLYNGPLEVRLLRYEVKA